MHNDRAAAAPVASKGHEDGALPPSDGAPDPPEGVQLRFWQRFHVRLTLFHGAIVMLVLAAMSVAFYELSYHAELSGLQGRLRSTVAVLAQSLDGDFIAEVDAGEFDHGERYDRLRKRFAEVAESDADIGTAYIMRRTGTPGQLQFVLDYASDGNSAKPGEAYDASKLPVLLRGLDAISVESQLYRDEWGASLSGYAPVRRANGESVGLVGVDVAAPRIEHMRERVLLTTLAFGGVAALLLALVAVLVGRRVKRTLTQIHRAAARIADGDFDARLDVHRTDELGVVAGHFDTIARSLGEREFLRDTFGRYVSRDVARRVLASGGAERLSGEERDVTIVFSDLQGYSTMSERVGPQMMVDVLNRYLSAMTAVIEQHDGCVIEFLGDAILTVFNAPADVSKHAESAVRCALAMRDRLGAFNDEMASTPVAEAWREAGFDLLGFRVGVHSGPVVAGTLGSRTRVKYGLIGDPVNVAARLEQMNKRLGTTILVSETTVEHLPEPLRSAATDRGEQEVRGRRGRVRVYAF